MNFHLKVILIFYSKTIRILIQKQSEFSPEND